MNALAAWLAVCELDDIIPDSGVCAEIGGRQVAVFRVDNIVYAIANRDPASGANVLSRGIVGDLAGEIVVASPIFKHHFGLATGRCVEEPAYSVETYAARVVDGKVWVQRKARAAQRAGKRKLIVIGNGMAGMRAVEELLEIAPNAYDIEVFGAEPHGNYNRILLSPVLSGEKSVADIMLNPIAWYVEHGVKLHLGDPAVEIDRVRRRVRSQSGVVSAYDRLLLATGSNPVVLPVPGNDLEGVVTFRDLRDVDAMLAAARAHRRAVVIGGGLLGLEAANGLQRQGMQVTVVHLRENLMERQLDSVAARLLRESLEERGIQFRMPAVTARIIGDSRVTGIRFSDGVELPTDLVVMAVGIRPNIELAKRASIPAGRGILVDDTMQTFDPSIYAVGECVQHRDMTYGLVAPLWEQARVCAAHLAEVGVVRYRGSLLTTQLKVTGISLFSAGDLQESLHSESLVFSDQKRGVYKRVILEDDRVRGAVLYGDTADAGWYTQLMSADQPIGSLRHTLLLGGARA